MAQEDWPLVTLSDIGYLRLDWPRDVFTFVGRHQCELEQMRKTCRERFGPTVSGTCPTCEKYIQLNLGKHVALCDIPWYIQFPAGLLYCSYQYALRGHFRCGVISLSW